MEKLTDIKWWEAALVRAIRTFCQTFIGLVSVGAAMEDVDWIRTISVSLVAFILSIFTSIATGLPEAKKAKDDEYEDLFKAGDGKEIDDVLEEDKTE